MFGVCYLANYLVYLNKFRPLNQLKTNKSSKSSDSLSQSFKLDSISGILHPLKKTNTISIQNHKENSLFEALEESANIRETKSARKTLSRNLLCRFGFHKRNKSYPYCVCTNCGRIRYLKINNGTNNNETIKK